MMISAGLKRKVPRRCRSQMTRATLNTMARVGVPDSLGIMIAFLVITILNLVLVTILLKNVKQVR